MSKKVNLICILVLILFIQFKGSNGFDLPFSDPDLQNPLIPLQWRELCGYRHFPIRVTFPQKCFKNSFEDVMVPYPLNLPRKTITSRVLGGRDVQYRESPWTVQITKKVHLRYWWGWPYSEYWHSCTGVLLTMRHILTAAHCWDNKIELRIYVGRDKTASGWSSDKYDFYKHPNFTDKDHPNGYTSEWDIAVMVLKTSIDWEFWHRWEQNWGPNWKKDEILINTICLPKEEDPRFANISEKRYRNATFFGWGKFWQQELPDILKRGDVPVRDSQSKYFEFKAEQNESRQCSGDSGGGLVQYLDEYESRAVLIGINIFSYGKYIDPTQPCIFEYQGQAFANRVVRHIEWIYEILQKYPDI